MATGDDKGKTAACPLCNCQSSRFTCAECISDGKDVKRSTRGIDRALFVGQTKLSDKWARRSRILQLLSDPGGANTIQASCDRLLTAVVLSLKEKSNEWKRIAKENQSLKPKNSADFAQLVLATNTRLRRNKKTAHIRALRQRLQDSLDNLDLEHAELHVVESLVEQKRAKLKMYPPKNQWPGKLEEAKAVLLSQNEALLALQASNVELRRQHVAEVIQLFRITPTSVLGASLPATGSFFTSMLDHSFPTKFGLGILVHTVNLISTYLDIDLPHAISMNTFDDLPVRTRNEDVKDQWKGELREKLRYLNYNILYMFHKDGMDVSALQPKTGQEFQTLPNLSYCCNHTRNQTLGDHADQPVAVDLSEYLSEPLEEFVVIE